MSVEDRLAAIENLFRALERIVEKLVDTVWGNGVPGIDEEVRTVKRDVQLLGDSVRALRGEVMSWLDEIRRDRQETYWMRMRIWIGPGVLMVLQILSTIAIAMALGGE